MFGKIYSEGFSAKGQRVSNQDRFAMHNGVCTTDCYVEQTIMANDELIYYILADGIGSMTRGGDAASLAVNRLIEWFKSYDTWKANNYGAFEKFIEEGFDIVNQAVIEESIKTLDRWGTTLAALIIYKNNYYIANVGDSLIYKSSGNIARLQTEVSEAIHNRVLHNYIGNKLCSGSEMVRISKGKCTEGSFFLLCTDGLALVNDYSSNSSLMNNREPRSLYDFFSSLERYQLEDNCTILKVVLARLNTTILEDAIVRCESDSVYAKDILKNADRYFENWDEIIANRTRTYSVAEFVEMVSKDWEINPRTVRNWLGKKMPSRDNVLKMCASLNYGVNAANILLEKDAHYSRLDPTNTIDYAWCRLLNSESHSEENLLERFSLYLEEAYEKLPQGNYGDDYKECMPKPPEVDLSWDNVSDKLTVRLLEVKRNREFLSTMPYVSVGHGLAVIADINMGEDRGGDWRIAVNNGVLESLGVDKETLFAEAMKNSAAIEPATLVDMSNALFSPERTNLLDRDEPLSPDEISGMYVLTNESGTLGAAALFYPDVKEKAGELLGSDYFILPSSTHEVILVPDNPSIDAKDLCDMVKQANRTVVEEKDILSDNVYHYSREDRRLDRVNADPVRDSMVAEAR